MLKEGTKTRSSKQIAEQSDQLGAMIAAQAPWGSETATFTASGLSDNASQWIPLASDVLLNPSFPESELNKLKQRLKVQLQQQRSTAGFSGAGTFQSRGLWQSSGRHHLADAAGHRQDHARHAGRVAQHPIRA